MQKPRFETRCNEPLAEACLKEAHERGLKLLDVWDRSGLSWSTINNLRRQKHPYGISLRTVKGLAKGIGGKLVILTEDGRIIDPDA